MRLPLADPPAVPPTKFVLSTACRSQGRLKISTTVLVIASHVVTVASEEVHKLTGFDINGSLLHAMTGLLNRARSIDA